MTGLPQPDENGSQSCRAHLTFHYRHASVSISTLVPHIDIVFRWVDPEQHAEFFFAVRVDKVIFVELLVDTGHVNTSLFECGRYLMRSTLRFIGLEDGVWLYPLAGEVHGFLPYLGTSSFCSRGCCPPDPSSWSRFVIV